jgi:hypothetical protein
LTTIFPLPLTILTDAMATFLRPVATTVAVLVFSTLVFSSGIS